MCTNGHGAMLAGQLLLGTSPTPSIRTGALHLPGDVDETDETRPSNLTKKKLEKIWLTGKVWYPTWPIPNQKRSEKYTHTHTHTHKNGDSTMVFLGLGGRYTSCETRNWICTAWTCQHMSTWNNDQNKLLSWTSTVQVMPKLRYPACSWLGIWTE